MESKRQRWEVDAKMRQGPGQVESNAAGTSRSWSGLAWLAVALYASWAFRDFLGDGLPIVFDAHSHLARAWFVERAFQAGQYPAWANDWYGGYRLLEFYSPGWYWVTAGAGLLLGDLVRAAKLVVWAAQVLSVLLLFGLVRRMTDRTLPAVLAAVLLIHSAERGMVIGILGNYPSVFLYLAIPALLSHIWSSSAGGIARSRLFAGQALLVGVMLVGHFANAILVLPAILVFEVTRLAQAASGPRDRVNALTAVAGSLAAGFALAAFSLVPAFLNLDRASLSLDRAWLDVGQASLERLLIAAGMVPVALEHPFLRNHGTAWVALGVAAGLASLIRAQRSWLPLFAGLCANLATVAFVDERAAIGLAFFLYPLCAVAIDRVSRWGEALRLPASRIVVPAAGIAAAVVFPVRSPPLRYVPVSDFDVYRAIPDSPTRSRTFDVTRSGISLDAFYGQSSFSPRFSQRAIPFGAYPQGASLATYLRLALASMLVEELAGEPPTISDDALDVLYLDHVQFLVARGESPVTARLSLAPGTGEAVAPGLLVLRHASPAIFSPELAPLPAWVREAGGRDASPRLLGVLERNWQQDSLRRVRPPSLDPLFRTGSERDWSALVPLLRAMELDRAQARAARIFVDELLPPAGPRSSGPADFAVLSHLEQPTRVRIVARASRAGYLRISYGRDPDLAVSLDGEAVVATADALTGAVVLAFPAGVHAVEIRAPEPVLQVRCLWLSGFLASMLAALLAVSLRSPSSAGGP